MAELKKQFFRLLKQVKRKLIIKQAIESFYLALITVALTTFCWMLLSRFVIILSIERKIVLTMAFVILVCIIFSILKRPKDKHAIERLDQEGLDDRVKTAYHHLEDNSDIANLQREDTVNKMKQVMPQIQNQRLGWLNWKKLIAISLLLLFTYLGKVYPNDVMETAESIETEMRLVEEQKEQVEKLVVKHEQLVGNEAQELLKQLAKDTEEQREAEILKEDLLRAENQLNKLKQDAEKNKELLHQLSEQVNGTNMEEIANALTQMNQNELERQLTELTNRLNQMTESEMQLLRKELEAVAQELELSKQQLQNVTNQELEELISEIEESMKELIDSASDEENLVNAQTDLQQLARQLNDQMLAAGIDTSSPLTFAEGTEDQSGNATGQSSNNEKDGESSTSTNGSQSGNGSGTSGEETSNNGGTGSGSSSGVGNGKTSGDGLGGNGTGANGSGAGLGEGNQNLTIPQQVDGQENQEVDTGELGDGASEQQYTPNAPIANGEVRSYQEIYQNYENTYRQAIERNNYPDKLQAIIKEYFSEIEPREGDN